MNGERANEADQAVGTNRTHPVEKLNKGDHAHHEKV